MYEYIVLWNQNLGKITQKDFLSKFSLFCHNFVTRNARKTIKSSRDSEFNLVSHTVAKSRMSKNA